MKDELGDGRDHLAVDGLVQDVVPGPGELGQARTRQPAGPGPGVGGRHDRVFRAVHEQHRQRHLHERAGEFIPGRREHGGQGARACGAGERQRVIGQFV